ncbi:MAG: stage III sporulation protein AE [Syntrophaceticus sp.]|jgi:stage III sporulation protein AE|nr:stage III sporulation protein AE [Syntrophaceticus sp.]MDD4359713.1 stage III sporulation protein AE [Syntrophaceticus sp.]MDD4782957.1 stage III sporulation protein AE [Syntrophaceticus sp.]
MQVRSKVFMLCFIICFLFFPNPSLASEQKSILNDQVEQLQLDEVDGFLNKIDQDIHDQLSGISLTKLLDDVRHGKLDLDMSDIFNALLRYFCREFLTHTSLLGKLIILGALLAIIEHLQNAFEQNTVAKLAHAVGMLALLTVALSSFGIALNTGREAISNMVGFMQAMIPVLLTLMAAMGNVTTVAVMQPVIFVSSNILATLINNIVFPLIFCAAVLSIVSSLSERFKVNRLADLFRDGSVFLVSLFLTIFIGILGIQGVAGAVTDGVGLRTAKFLTGSFVPVVGGVLTDAVDVIVGCSLFIKNGMGIIGALGILLMCALPVVKILSVAVMYRLAAVLMEPIGAEQISENLHLLGNLLFIAFGAVAAVGLMFFIVLTIIVGLGNFSVMLR